MAEGLATESQKSLQMEAEMEKQLADWDTERTQLSGRLSKEETKNQQLQADLERLKQQLESYETLQSQQPIEIKSIQRQVAENRLNAQAANIVKSFKNTPPSTPPEVRRAQAHNMIIRESPERDSSPSTNLHNKPPPVLPDGGAHQRGGVKTIGGVVSGSSLAAATFGNKSPAEHRTVMVERPVVAEKPPDLGARMAAATASSASPSGPTMFTTPSGTRITVAVGGGASASSSASPATGPPPRKPGIGSRVGGPPPPVPPNKPQVVIPARYSSTSSSSSSSPQSSPSPTSPSPVPPPAPKPRGVGGAMLMSAGPTVPGSQTQITVANDKITISSSGTRPVSVNANQTNMFQTNTTSSSAPQDHITAAAPRQKTATPQVCAGASFK